MLTIGRLSAETGVPTSTLRFWERKGLLTPDTRVGGQRRYAERALRKVAVLQLCQDAGLTLAEIERVMPRPARENGKWQEFVRDKLAAIEASQERLRRAHHMLSHALECDAPDIDDCPRFQEEIASRVTPGGRTGSGS